MNTLKHSADYEESRQSMLSRVKPGDTVHCIVRSVARSGMSRRIDFYVVEDGELR